MVKRAYVVHYETVEYAGTFPQTVLVVANTKEQAKKKFSRFADNYPWSPHINEVRFVKVGALNIVVA